MPLDAFTAFLLLSDNTAVLDQQKDTWHDITQPLAGYFISSSHNTYLVGHQLVGDSTIEGYIRALLRGCRSVERKSLYSRRPFAHIFTQVDIYDSEVEPVIFHGKTLTPKVSLREVCETIAKYGFVASPYPVIISSEVHCSFPQQDLIAEIMIEVFGDALVRVPPEDASTRIRIEELPSPENLKGRIMFKTKNLEIGGADADNDTGYTPDQYSASDSDMLDTLQDAPASTSATQLKQSRRQSDQIKGEIDIHFISTSGS